MVQEEADQNAGADNIGRCGQGLAGIDNCGSWAADADNFDLEADMEKECK